MINNDKTTNFSPIPQIAGLMPNDSTIEIFGIGDQRVLWMQNGKTKYFKDLPTKIYNLLKNAYLEAPKAVEYLSKVSGNTQKQVELYAYYMWGQIDTTPDIKNGVLSDSENFRDSINCPSLLWNSKNINIGSHILTPRQLIIIDSILIQNLPDKAIAAVLGISITTLDFHKAKLLKAVGVTNKMELQKLALKYKVIAL